MFNKKIKIKVIKMRKLGKSIEEIKSITGISKGTLSVWLRDVLLTEKAAARLNLRKIKGQRKVSNILKNRKIFKQKEAQLKAFNTLKSIPVSSKEQSKLTCALIYYCEGVKSDKRISFTNSDPDLMKTFLFLFRNSFILDESRFRVQLHLHSYHNEKRQKVFWSKVMRISESLFIKSFHKKEGGIFKKEGYPGCATVRYHDVVIARELLEIAKQYFKTIY